MAGEALPLSSRRIPQLDGLRGIAIAMVLVFHFAGRMAGIQPRLPLFLAFPINFGWAGVDLFFVLSGFLIGGILLDARGSLNYFRVFYIRRVCRIVPVYFAFLAAYFITAHFVHANAVQRLLSPAIPWQACVTFTQNLWMAVRNDIGAVAVSPTWSLAIEEQFYLLLPALVYFLKPGKLIWAVGAGIVLAPLIRLAIYLANPQLTYAIAYQLPCRMNALLLGVAVAYFWRRPAAREYLRAHRREFWTALEVLTCLTIATMMFASAFSAPVMLIGYDVIGLFFAGILVVALTEEKVARVLQARWLMGLGHIAYGAYLIHELVFGMTYLALNPPAHAWTAGTSWAVTTIVALIATLGIAKLSWEYFEKPLVRLGHREQYWPAATPAAGDAPEISKLGAPADS